MAELIEKLTEKIYAEGVQKARQEGEKIISEAKTKGVKIIEDAKKEAGKIVDQAKKESEILKKNTETDIKMTAQKAVASLKQSVEKLITANLADAESKEILKDTAFIKKIMEKIIEQWVKSGSLGEALVFKVAEKDLKDIEIYFKEKSKEMLNKKIIFQPDQQISAGFAVEPKDGGFRIGFTDKDFNDFLKGLARDSIKGYLFS